MPEDEQPSLRFERWLGLAGNVIAPATAISALLFYFGYVSSRSQYEYFGLDVDTIGLTTQDFIMRSPQPLLVPLLVLAVLGAAAVLAQASIRHRLTSAFARPDPGPAITARRWIRRGTTGGLLLMAAGFVLLMLYPLLRDWPWFNLLTPLVIALGGSVAAYSLSAARYAASLEPAADGTPATVASGTEPEPEPKPEREPASAPADSVTTTVASPAGASSPAPGSPVLLRPAVSVFILVAVAAAVFWATATVAQWSGVGLAQSQAERLDVLPSVILDTKERLFLTSPGLSEVSLPPSAGQTFHYRYRHLRLLIQGQDRMFLVPDKWSPSDSTLLVRLDPSVRMQFQFTNQPP